MRLLFPLFGLAAYLFFLAVFLHLVGWLSNIGVARGIDGGTPGPLVPSLLIDLGLVALFGAQHSVMARPWFKRAWTAVVPEPAERSVYVLSASLLLGLLMWAWRPIPTLVWDCAGGRLGAAILGLSALGWFLLLVSTCAIDHFHLFGLRQTFHAWLGRRPPETPFMVRGPYHVVRHPLMLGFLVAFWSAPQMSVGRLVFASAMTAYILVALVHEDRDLRAAHGALYDSYAARTPRLNPFARVRR